MEPISTSEQLLGAAYQDLRFSEGALYPASDDPAQHDNADWLNKGDWLALAKTVGVDRVFFVRESPVVVFARYDGNEGVEAVRKLVNRIWCMARPPLLFLATPGQLAAYDLTTSPTRPGEGEGHRLLKAAKTANEVQLVLRDFARDQIESGRIFEKHFAQGVDRADKALIRDLKMVRRELRVAGLELPFAHALIGRSIFIRYLEDRGVLTPDYFRHVAKKRKEWLAILSAPAVKPYAEPDMQRLLYLKVLSDKDFTYALFEQLAEDFNGDMFPRDRAELAAVSPKHLDIVQGFLRGDITAQQKLFFFAYKFDVIPIGLISSLYEEFYHTEQGSERTQGSHYTPSSLVEFVLSQVLSPQVLDSVPRVVDPACGSGIFLVETFRRIVRHRMSRQSRSELTREELSQILRTQIAGVDINEQAVRVAAFSLYLALLHYQKPPDIRHHKRLPNLLYGKKADERPGLRNLRFDILVCGNSFALESVILDKTVLARFGAQSFGVVVGNPPWGHPKRADRTGIREARTALAWCERSQWPVGDKELSQAFIHLSLTLLHPGGRAGLLVSAGVFFKNGSKSRDFRSVWLKSVALSQVVNFAHVRDVFFRGEHGKRSDTKNKASKGGGKPISPFCSVVFTKEAGVTERSVVEYWSAKKTALVKSQQAVVISKIDLKRLRQIDLLQDDTLWKIYWWGSHRDEALVGALRMDVSLGSLSRKILVGQGFKEANAASPSGWLSKYKELPVHAFRSYGPLDRKKLVRVPARVERHGVKEVYSGHRILVKAGISESEANGRIHARLEVDPFCFRNSINGFRLIDFAEWEGKAILGVFWSSLARYFFFLTAGSWGMWHHQLHQNIIETMPIRLPTGSAPIKRIVALVDSLRKTSPPDPGLPLLHRAGIQQQEKWERQLDDAVFDLYELSPTERDLVSDMCEVGLDLFYRHAESDAVKPVETHEFRSRRGLVGDLPTSPTSRTNLARYLRAFLQVWNQELAPDGEFSWQILGSNEQAPVVAVRFSTQRKGERPTDTTEPADADPADAEWEVFKRDWSSNALVTYGSSRVLVDGALSVVTPTDIVIVKRNERRFWTASAAREDAEATFMKAMQLPENGVWREA